MVLRALLALALMLNGTALPPAMAASDVLDAAAHAGHHGPGYLPDQAPAHDPDDSPASDCCDGMGCGCGCAGPQLVPLPVAATSRAWDGAPAVFILASAPFSASLIAAPFRPPA